MKFSFALTAGLVGLAAAAPPGQLQRRQATQNDLKTGSCKKATLIFARASTEGGNMGGSMGPVVCSGLKSKLGAGNVSCQGVGSPYSAGLADNVGPKGTSMAAIGEATKMFKLAISKCPQTLIVAGGYSQGTAVIMNAVSTLPPEDRSKVVGVVLFGYTKNGQTKGTIPNYPSENLKVFCTKADGVCWGALNVSGGHFAYMGNGDGTAAISFLVGKINNPNAAKAAGSGAPAAEGEGEAAPKMPKGKGKGAKGPDRMDRMVRRGRPVGRDF